MEASCNCETIRRYPESFRGDFSVKQSHRIARSRACSISGGRGLLGRKDVSTKMIYNHVSNRDPDTIRYSADHLISRNTDSIRLAEIGSPIRRAPEVRKDDKPDRFKGMK
jgi:hypothetical protein